MNTQRQERRRKFHESLLNMLYAPPPSPPPSQKEFPKELPEISLEGDHITDELEEEESSSSASDDEAGLGTRKLTRAQRKRLRKKKLKEAALNRRKIIGPELPSSILIGNDHHLHPEGGDIVAKHQSQDVRRIAAEGLGSGIEQQMGDPPSCTSQNKPKKRRVSRKLAKERLKPLTKEDCHQVPTLACTNNEAS